MIKKLGFLLMTTAVLFITTSCLYAADPGTIKWRYPLESHSCYSPAISHDNTIYAPSENNLLAINPDGTLKWSFEAGGTVNTPSVDSNGNVYFQSDDGVYSLNSSGDLLWLYMPYDFWPGYDCGGKISIDTDGTIYTSYGGSELHAIDPAGNGKWVAYGYSNPAISTDGNLYDVNSGGYIYILNKEDGSRLAYAQTSASYINPPTIGSNGNIYIIGQGPLNTFSSDLTKLWETENLGNFAGGPGQATVGPDRVIYVNIWNHFDSKQYLYAINPDGTKKWALEMTQPAGSPIIGNDGIIYVASSGYDSTGGFSAIDSSGSLVWSVVPNGKVSFQSWTSPVMGDDGVVYVIGYENGNHYLYAINTSSTGPANSSWPMMGANAQHTYRVTEPPAGTSNSDLVT